MFSYVDRVHHAKQPSSSQNAIDGIVSRLEALERCLNLNESASTSSAQVVKLNIFVTFRLKRKLLLIVKSDFVVEQSGGAIRGDLRADERMPLEVGARELDGAERADAAPLRRRSRLRSARRNRPSLAVGSL